MLMSYCSLGTRSKARPIRSETGPRVPLSRLWRYLGGPDARFEEAGEAWDVALPIAALRQQAGISQQELARWLKTSQPQVSRLESPAYEEHSLSMSRRVAKALSRIHAEENHR